MSLYNRILGEIESDGYRIRPPRLEDFAEILELQHLCVNPKPSRRYNSYEFYRIVRFGMPLVLIDPEGSLAGFDLAVSYAPDIALTAGYAVHPSHRGRGLSCRLLSLSMLRALKLGARVRQGVVHPRNCASLVTLLNHLGFFGNGYLDHFVDFEEPRLTHGACLSVRGMLSQRIDLRKLEQVLAREQRGKDYRRFRGDDRKSLGAFARDGFAIVACIPPRSGVGIAELVAFPIDRLRSP